MVLITAAICVTALLITLAICHTVLECVEFKYRDREVFTPEQNTNIQEQLDKDREKNKVPTMDEMVILAQQLIGGDDDAE